MLKPYQKNSIWTKEKCKEEASKYEYKSEFKKGNSSAYNSAYFNGWLNEICSHMIQVYKPKNYWTKEKCQEEALKYNYRMDFKLKSSVCYAKAIKLGCLHEISLHMYSKYKQNDITKEQCQKEALKYKTRTNFCRGSRSFYNKSRNSDWLDEICSHMISQGNRFNRCIYAYEFSDNNVYIGLTYNLKNRHYRHMNIQKNSSVLKHINKTNLVPKLIQLTDYVSIDDASILEGEFISIYKNNGWFILNRIKSGGLGGIRLKWTKDKCQKEALKYKTKSEFAKNSPSAYSSANKHNFLNEICYHMKEIKKPNGYWVKEECIKEALKYTKIAQYYKKSKGSYNSAKRNGWLNEICSHMKKVSKKASI